MSSLLTPRRRSPLSLGWEAAKANALPAFILQALMVSLLLAYFYHPPTAHALNRLAQYKKAHGLMFVVCASAFAGGIAPELFVIVFLQRGLPTRANLRNLMFTVPIWALDGAIVDLLYRTEARWFGDSARPGTVFAKLCFDMLVYNPLFAAPYEILTYEWKNSGFSLAPVRAVVKWPHYRDKIIPTLCATWAVWLPLLVVIYSLPLALQFPLFSIALTFWVLLLIYMTNRFSENNPDAKVPPTFVAAASANLTK